ncbi:MAG TPA: hypothetical protein VGO25_06680, partial [Rhodanobacteraceae bacterium]|nr:hypothetical protein [Rhodanobacteraceae bacterium]
MKDANDPNKARRPAIVPATGLLAYCRPGFEGECAQELTAVAAERDIAGFARTERGSGFVEYVDGGAATEGARALSWRELAFSRQLLSVLGRATSMQRSDRLASLMPIIE